MVEKFTCHLSHTYAWIKQPCNCIAVTLVFYPIWLLSEFFSTIAKIQNESHLLIPQHHNYLLAVQKALPITPIGSNI